MQGLLLGTPYSLSPEASESLLKGVSEVEQRKELLRSQGKLTKETLELYFGKTRFEQIAESNAIEGSTLDVGETELAVLKGITVSGHDPGYSHDAQSLARALTRLSELARVAKATDLQELKELHELVLEGRPTAGAFRNSEVLITGSKHHPPRNWKEIMPRMEEWDAWSKGHFPVPAPIRSTVLHAWLTHVHPFIDGNGRTARAIGTLELVRAGYPPIIIRKNRDRTRYIGALRESDEAGDLSLLFELVLERLDDSLRDLERAATIAQGYNPIKAKIRNAQEGRLAIWNSAIQLLADTLSYQLRQRLESSGGRVSIEVFRDSLSLDEYISLCEGRPASMSWAFRILCSVPGLSPLERLAWAGFCSPLMRGRLPKDAATPAVFWSARNLGGYPPWTKVEGNGAPGADELSLVGDLWFLRRGAQVDRLSTEETAHRIADDVVQLLH